MESTSFAGPTGGPIRSPNVNETYNFLNVELFLSTLKCDYVALKNLHRENKNSLKRLLILPMHASAIGTHQNVSFNPLQLIEMHNC